MNPGPVAAQLEDPGRRIGEESLDELFISPLKSAAVEGRPGECEVGQDVCASGHVVTLRPAPGATRPSLPRSAPNSLYGGSVTRTPLFLAALASAAVPGLDPVSVEGVRTRPGGSFDVAFVTDSQDRRWVIKAPLTQGAGAELEAVATLGQLLGRRLDVAMPMVRGEVPVPEGRAIVYLRLPGRPVDLETLPPGTLSSDLGRALAHIHNLELALFEEAGRPVYDAESHRRRQLSELDRAAATGHVPTNLLVRWEQRLEDISLWRFAPTPVHGSFVGDNVLAAFEDEDRADAGEVRGVLGWEESRIGDPADDFAELVRRAPADALDMVLHGYAQSRVERPDGNLLARARLAAEMTPLRTLLQALASSALDVVEDAAESLRVLEARISAEDEQRAVEADRDSRGRASKSETTQAETTQGPRGLRPPAPEEGPRRETVDMGAERPEVPAEPPQAAVPAEPPEPDWDATAPHQPFPDQSETQAVVQDPGAADEGHAGKAGRAWPRSSSDPSAESVAETSTASSPGGSLEGSSPARIEFELDEVDQVVEVDEVEGTENGAGHPSR